MDKINDERLGFDRPAADDVDHRLVDGVETVAAAQAQGAGAGPGEQRRSRDSLLLSASMRIGSATEAHDVRIRNLSEGGMMIEFDRALAVDTAVMLDIRGIGEVAGRIAWCTEGRMGIALDAPIDPKKARKPVGAGATTPTFAKPIVFRAPRGR